MTITASSAIIHVDLTNADGHTLGRSVPVILEYVQEVEYRYGEDADGNSGTMLVEYTILDTWIEAGDLKRLTAQQAEWAIVEAKTIFHARQKHF